MYIDNALLDLIIASPLVTIEYSGTHNSDPKAPLWGRRAYWRVYIQGSGFAFKITAPVKSISPKKATLDKLFKAELKNRFEAIGEHFTTDHYGRMQVEYRDPYSVKQLLKVAEGYYYDMYSRQVKSQLEKAG